MACLTVWFLDFVRTVHSFFLFFFFFLVDQELPYMLLGGGSLRSLAKPRSRRLKAILLSALGMDNSNGPGNDVRFGTLKETVLSIISGSMGA